LGGLYRVSYDVYATSKKKYLDKLPRLGVSAGTGIDPVLAGINATEVPKEAKVVNNVEANLQYDTSLWKDRRATRFYSPSSLVTVTRGASLTYTFEGVAIW